MKTLGTQLEDLQIELGREQEHHITQDDFGRWMDSRITKLFFLELSEAYLVNLTQESVVMACLDAIGPLEVSEATHAELLRHAEKGGDLAWSTNEDVNDSEAKVSKMLTLIAASRDYQFA